MLVKCNGETLAKGWGSYSDPTCGNVSDTNKQLGVVKWYNSSKGYGFLKVEGREKDIFFHAKAWNALGTTALPVDGEPIAFTLEDGPKGSYATNLERKGASIAPGKSEAT